MCVLLNTERLDKIASFMPKKLRLELFKAVYRQCESSPTATAKAVGIHPRQVYFYLIGKNGRVRNYPNDETTALILRAGLKLNPDKTLAVINEAFGIFADLVKQIER